MKTLLKFTAFTIFYLLTFHSFGQNMSTSSFTGYWKTVGYGFVIEITEENVQFYDVNKMSCAPNLSQSIEEFFTEFEVIESTNSFFTAKGGITEYDFERIDQLPDVCRSITKTLQQDPLHNFDALWETFSEQFAYFKERDIDWNRLRTKYRSQISKKTKPFDLFMTLHTMVEELNDGHSMIGVPEGLEKKYAKYRKRKQKERIKELGYRPEPINTDDVRYANIDLYIDDVKEYLFGNIYWGITKDNVAIVQINGMANLANYNIPSSLSDEEAEIYYAEQAEASSNYLQDEVNGTRYIMDKILEEISGTKACILDIRFNGGGFDGVGMEIVKSFAQQEGIAFVKNTRLGEGFTRPQSIEIQPMAHAYSRPLFLLTSYQSASAAESFSMAMKALSPDLQIIGSPTNGIFSDMIEKKLPNGWDYALSTEVYANTNGVNYEGKGIQPDYAIEYKKKGYWFYDQIKTETLLHKKDTAIDKVLKLLKQ